MYIIGAILRWAVLAGYLAASCFYIAPLLGSPGRPGRNPAATTLLAVTIVLHLILLVATVLESGKVLFLTSALAAASLYALIVATVTLAVQARIHNASIGAFSVPLAALLDFISLLDRPTHAGINPILDSNWFEIHATSAFLGYAAFALAFVTAIMYLALAARIRTRRLGTFFERLPSLDLLDRIGRGAAAVGLLFFTIGLVTGSVWSAEITGHAISGEPKELLSFLTWGLFAIQVALSRQAGWRGRRPAILSILGFLCSLVTIIGGASGRHPL